MTLKVKFSNKGGQKKKKRIFQQTDSEKEHRGRKNHVNRILALILPALSRCYQSIQPTTNSNALQGRQNRRDVNGEQLTGLEPTTLCSMVAPAQHPNQHPHVGMHIFCTSQKGKKATHTLLHEFSHCLGYKLFEHSHNTLSSF